MAARRRTRDTTRGYPKSQSVAKLRWLDDSIETAEEIGLQITPAPEAKP